MKQGFYLWRVQSRAIRISLDLIDRLNTNLSDPRLNHAEEHGGILYGTVTDGVPEISKFEFFRSEHRRGIVYDLGARERAVVRRVVASQIRRRGEKPIGYFRTHHRPGFFLDQDDFALMSEVFPNPDAVALLIRPEPNGTRKAGFFFWQNGDIDRKQTQLIFPFDSQVLAPQAEPVLEPVVLKHRAAFTQWQLPKISPKWAAAALVLPAVAAVVALRHIPSAVPRDAAPATQVVRVEPPQASAATDETIPGEAPPASPEVPQVEVAEAPPAVFEETSPTRPAKSQPAPTRVPPVPVQVAAPPSAPPVQPAPAPVQVAEATPPEPVHPKPERPKTVFVAVSLEPRVTRPEKDSQLRKTIGRVPLLGHPFRPKDQEFTPAKPEGRLEPRVPRALAQELSDELPVDVRLAIDSRGVVQSAEVLRGKGTSFASLAADSASATVWHPAQLGEREVPSEMIVHYRFRPTD